MFRPIGVNTGISFLLVISSKVLVFIVSGIPTKPNAFFSGFINITLFSLVVIEWALQDFFFKALTISLLNSIKTFSTTPIIFSFVTLKPPIKVLSILSSVSLFFILGPPP